MPKRFFYTDDHLEFLRLGYLQMRIPELTGAFNQAFDLDKSCGAIKSALSNRRFTCGRPNGNVKGYSLLLSPEQVNYVREHYTSLPIRELTERLNTEFGSTFTDEQLKAFTTNHNITSGRTGCFEKGSTPPNKGVKGWDAGGRSHETRFKKGSTPPNINPIGHERICTKDGYILIKIAEPNPFTGAPTRYEAKHRVVWRAENGEIPKGCVIVFLDGDKLNCDLDNLRCVTRGVLQYLNKSGLNNTTGEARKSAILTAEVVTKTYSLRRESA